MKTIQTIMGEYDIEKAKKFIAVFNSAKGKDFFFDDHPVLWDFAKFFVEFLRMNFKDL